MNSIDIENILNRKGVKPTSNRILVAKELIKASHPVRLPECLARKVYTSPSRLYTTTSIPTPPGGYAHTYRMNSVTHAGSRLYALQKRPILPTAQASTSARQRQTESGSATGRWIPLSTPSGTPSSRLQSALPTSSLWKSSSKAEKRCLRQRRWHGCCSHTVNIC